MNFIEEVNEGFLKIFESRELEFDKSKYKKGSIVYVLDSVKRKTKAVKSKVVKDRSNDFEIEFLEDGIEDEQGMKVGFDLKTAWQAGHIALNKSDLGKVRSLDIKEDAKAHSFVERVIK